MARAPLAPPPDGKPAKTLGPLKMIWAEALKYPRQVIFALIALLVSSAATLAIPYRFKQIIDKAFGARTDVTVINHSFLYLMMIVVVLGLASAMRFYFVSWLGERVVADLRLRVQNNLLRLSPGFFEENSPKEISSRMTSDTAIIEQVVGTTVSVALRNLITGLGGIVLLFVLAPVQSAWLVGGAFIIAIVMRTSGRRIRNIARSSQDRVAEVGARVAEVLGAMKIVQGFNQEQRESARFGEAVEATFATAKRRILLRAGVTALFITLVFGAITALMWDGALSVASGKISGGTIAAIVVVGVMVSGAFAALSEVYADLLRGAGAASRLHELLNEKPSIAAPARPTELPVPPRGSLAFQNVTFRYPTRLDVAAVEDFSLLVEPGETVAIVGPSGAGKSTLFQLAERFYDPQAGTIRLDGVPLTSADPAEIRRRMAFVPQDGTLFAANARDNLRYGNWQASDEQIWEAAEHANAAEFLKKLPEGLDTFLGEGGARLSGGQRQRVAIARALLRDAPILLLDEATSALDAESERLVQDALDRLMAERTTLVIAHRLATVRAADRIVVMDGGKIVEQGTHAELTKMGGLYARLASLQFDDKAFAASK
ncbi:MAG: ATP-binding cassette domain-containing protein [Novosphingobium sp.]|nr:ATP-binding cassette domain-containing protein [Novosphingobium sp.]MBO9602208.1 ATP-binding cassette domain-containing protein [Novosphingobium sp.]